MTYKEFIENIITTRGQWNIPDDEYFEVHHITPRCKGGLPKRIKHHNKKRDNIHSNLIWLYPAEHYIAHKLLAQENPDDGSLVIAWSIMAFGKSGNQRRDYELTPDEYAELMIKASISRSNLLRGKVRTPEQRERYRQSKLGDKNPYFGKSSPMKGRNHSDESKKAMSLKKQGLYDGENNPSYGKHWYNNGVNNVYIKGECPDGYVPGILRRKNSER